MLELGDPRVGPPKLARGPVPGTRWTILRTAAPAQRNVGKVVWMRRVVVRCACGTERVAFEKDLEHGYSRGCRSKGCRLRNQGVCMANTDKVLVDRLAGLIDERKRESARHKAELERMEADTLAKVQAIDAEIASIELTLSILGRGTKGKSS